MTQRRARPTLAWNESPKRVARTARVALRTKMLGQTCAAAMALGLSACGGGGSHPEPKQEPATCTAAEAADPGTSPLRRLTRFELARTLSDVLGADPTVVDLLPPDERSSDGFDNNAAAYSVSTVHVQGWLELGEQVAESLVASPTRLATFAGCDPSTGDVACTSAFVSALGERLFRRPLGDDERASFLNVAATIGAEEPRAGVSAVVSAMLQSADFLYRPEAVTATSATEPVGADELTTRLAYLLTGTGPDATLLAAAAAGQLASEAGLLAETDRLLATPRAAEAFHHFVEEWWELDELAGIQKDAQLYRTWSAAMPAALAEETRRFLLDLWQTGPTIGAMLSSPRTFVDTTLAGLYGDPPPSESGFQPLSRDPARYAGLLTQGSFLATHAKANQTSPVLRGKFVRARLLCAPPPPPPADKVIVAPTVDPRLPTRQRFAKHSADPDCASCHKLMDPIGFAFEHFDGVGRWRETDAGQPVDATGMLTGTDVDGPIDGVAALGARLAASERVRACVATQWFRWAFARREASAADTCAIASLGNALAESQGDLRALMRATVLTPTFRTRRPSETPVQGDAP